MDKLQIAIRDGRVVLSLPTEKDDEVYSIRMSPRKARQVGFMLVEMADKIQSPWEETK